MVLFALLYKMVLALVNLMSTALRKELWQVTKEISMTEKGLTENPSIRPTTPVSPIKAAAPVASQSNVIFGTDSMMPVPPTKDELKAQYRKPYFDQNKYQQQLIRNRKAALREMLQENVVAATRVKDQKLLDNFRAGRGGD
jgi:hypothetical protein